MSTPTTPGTYLYTPDMPDAQPTRIAIVADGARLMACVPDPDEGEPEIHPVEDLSGTWALLT